MFIIFIRFDLVYQYYYFHQIWFSASVIMTESIDNEILISLVEARPVLWDKTQEIYRDRNATRNAWREICKKIHNQ